ncbi:hypothetical protein JCM10207_003498 [Rhodosporidiobolus poonsookiae]
MSDFNPLSNYIGRLHEWQQQRPSARQLDFRFSAEGLQHVQIHTAQLEVTSAGKSQTFVDSAPTKKEAKSRRVGHSHLSKAENEKLTRPQLNLHRAAYQACLALLPTTA